MKIVYSDKKTGKSAQAEVNADMAATLMSKRIGDIVGGEVIGLDGYKLKITGGSDSSGFPMHRYVQGSVKTTTLKRDKRGSVKGRSTVVGGVVSVDIAQINTVIEEYGSKPVEQLFGKPAAEKVEKLEQAGQKE